VSLQTRLSDFATRVGAEFKAVRAEKANASHTHPYQPVSSELGTIAGLSPTNGQLLRRVSGAWAASTITKADIGLGNVDNTADTAKPISIAQQTALDGKVGTLDARLTDPRAWSLYTPGGEAAGNVPTWDTATSTYKPGTPAAGGSGGGYRSGVVPSGSTTPVIQHDLGSSDLAVAVQDVSGRLITQVPVETVDGSGAPSDNHIRLTFRTAPTTGQYRYTIISAGPAPTVAQHAHTAAQVGAVPTTRQVIAGGGLTGGGDLSADRTLAVAYGTAAGTAAQGNDSRITGAVPNTRQVTAGTGLTGGGDLTANRSLAVAYGSGAGTAVQGNDARVTADQAVGTASIRTIGTGAQQAAAGATVAALPRGVIARQRRTSDNVWGGQWVQSRVMTVSVPVVAGRQYLVGVPMLSGSAQSAQDFYCALTYTTDGSEPAVNSPELCRIMNYIPAAGPVYELGPLMQGYDAGTNHTFRMTLICWGSGTTPAAVYGKPLCPIDLIVQDMGVNPGIASGANY
jgi:hypothetical protein